MRTLRVNETKATSRNTFIDNFFALESEEETKTNERTFFSDYPQTLDLAVDLETAHGTYMWFSRLFYF